MHSAFILADDVIEPTTLPPTVREVPVAAETWGTPVTCSTSGSASPSPRPSAGSRSRPCAPAAGKKDAAAKVLGISLKTLYNRLNLYRAQGQSIAEVKPPTNSL